MLTWLKRIILSAIGTVVVVILLLVGSVFWDANFGAKATDFTNVSFTAADGTELHGYLATPEGEGSFPAVMMIHEWWGLNREITELADKLAEEGYVVFAPDTYRGNTTPLIQRALYLRLTTPAEQIDADTLASFDYLASLPNVATDRIGLIGFCYGGGVVLRHAIANPRVAATITLYGDTVDDPTAFGALLGDGAGSLLGIYGGQDNSIPLTEVTAFENALAQTTIDYTVTVYDAMGHAFVQPDVIEEEGQPKEAWTQILAFFAAHLQADQS